MKIEIIDEEELTRQYDEVLDESSTHPNYSESEILKKCDPTAYRCGLCDYADSLSRDGVVCPDYYGQVYTCPECGDTYDDETEAKECCGGVEE